MRSLVNTSHQRMVLEGSGWAESDTCTLLAEQPQIGTIITEIRYVMMSLIINHFPVWLWVTIVSEHWKPWSFVEAASCRKIRSSLKSCYSAMINKGWSALFYFLMICSWDFSWSLKSLILCRPPSYQAMVFQVLTSVLSLNKLMGMQLCVVFLNKVNP